MSDMNDGETLVRELQEYSDAWDEGEIEDERDRLKEVVERLWADCTGKVPIEYRAASLAVHDRAQADLDRYNEEHPPNDADAPTELGTGALEGSGQPATVAAPAEKPWLIADPRDPESKQSWYTPARYFARQLVEKDSTLLLKRDALAEKVSQSLANAGIYKRGGKKAPSQGTVLKALSNVSLG